MINYTDRVRLALFIETVILGVERTANDYFKKDRSSHSSSPLSVQYLSERQATYVQLKQLGASILHELCGDKKVTLAIEIPNNRDCSPTFVAQSVNNEPDCFKDVSKEAEILKQFSGHKGIWPLLGYATHQKEDQTPTISIFTPLGIPTDRILRNNKNLPIFQHIELADQITCGVYTLHKENRIHGDLKPDNVLFSTISGSKIVAGLIDLGSSLLTSEGPGDPSYDRCYLSDGYYTSVVFTPPELFGNENFKGSLEKVEIFALGCLLYSLFLQKLPPWVNFLDEYWTYFRKKVMTSKTVFERTNKSFSKYVENYIEISRDTLLKKENLSIEKEYLLFIYNMMRLNPEDRLDSLSATKEIALLQEKALALQLKNTLKL